MTDLERRGLLQYDRQTSNYDLHPVVRAVVASSLASKDRERYGQRVVDHFSTRLAGRYSEATSMADLRGDMTIVRTLLQMGRLRAAYSAYSFELQDTLENRLEATPELLSTLKPFFVDGWCRRYP